jgi:uncharacterized membrane protein
VTPADETPSVPFEGLRRNARALGGGLVLLAVIFFLVPDLTPPTTTAPPVELVHGRIVELLPPSEDVDQPDVRIRAVDGPHKGELLEGHLQGPSGTQDLPRYVVGDEVVVNISTDPEAPFIAVADLYRVPVLGLLLGLFAAAVTIVGGWRGVRSLFALALTLAVVFDALARFTSLRGSEDATYLAGVGLTNIDIGGLLLAAIIFGALGILDDVTVTQAAAVQELYDSDPGVGRLALAARAMNVGRSHIAATVNTLVLAYLGASLPLIVLFAAGRQDPLLTASGETVAVEVVRALVGSIGIVAAVPVTTAIAVALTGRRLPFIREEPGLRHAPGWD